MTAQCTGVNVNIPLICALVPSFVLYLLLFDVKKLKLLYFFVSSVAVFSFGGLSTHYIEAILDMEMEIYIAYSIKWLVSLLFVIAEILFLKKLRWLLNNENVDTIWRFMWIVPIIITISNFLLIPLDEANVRAGRIFFMYLLFEAIMVVFFVVTLLMQYTIARAITNKVEAEQNSRLLGMQAAQYDNLKKYLDNTARVRHDFIYMANTARNLAASGDIDNLKKLLNDYGESIDANAAPPVYCNNTAINAITAHYVSEAQKKIYALPSSWIFHRACILPIMRSALSWEISLIMRYQQPESYIMTMQKYSLLLKQSKTVICILRFPIHIRG